MNWRNHPFTWRLCLVVTVLGGCAAPHEAAPVQPAEPPAPLAQGLLFDGRALEPWRITDFAGTGEVYVDDGRIMLEPGNDLTGITWPGPVVRMDYQVSLEAMKLQGSDFFCGLTFPVADDPCSLIVGGWGGELVGISSLDFEDAAHNGTGKFRTFETGRWYRIRLRVTPGRIEAWIDDEKLVDVDTTDRTISVRYEVEPSIPLGIATYRTKAALRHIVVRHLTDAD